MAFMNLAGCAMVSVADGTISKDEKTKMLAFVSKSELLKAFDTGTIVTRFAYFTDMFEFDFNTGRLECMKAIVKIKSNVEEAKLVVTVCCAIGASDGDFDEKEKMVVRDICTELGINPSDLQL
jgi:tellurite resistance protein TerB